jgi:hypothetical protein
MKEDQKKAVEEAKGSRWKKVLYWCLGILGAFGVIVLLIFIFKKKSPGAAASEIVAKAKQKIDAIDIEAKAEAAEAAKVEAVTVEKIRALKDIEDEKKRNEELAALLAEDY